MSDKRDDTISPTTSAGSENAGTTTARGAASAVADRAAEAGSAVWETARAARRQASERGRELGGQAYDVGRRALRGAGDRGLMTFIVGAALGYALAYTVYASGGQDRRRATGADDVIDTLNGLIAISYDGEEGFRTSAEGVKSSEVKTVFMAAAERCAEGARELQRKIQRLGGVPHEGGSVSGALHRRWVDLKSTITSMDDAAILNEVERGEDVAKAAYEKALRMPLPQDVRSMLHRHYQGVRQNHDRVRNLRDAMR